MSRSRRNFSAEFKTNLILQLLKGEKELNVLAVENDIQPNLLRNWKKEFLANASLAFDNKREDNLREKLAEERKEKSEYAKKVGQLTMQVDWLKKNLKKLSDLTTRVNLVRNLSTTKELPVSTGANLLGINRTSVYYGGIPVSEEELECKAVIDHLHTDNPTWGARQMSAQLKLRGYQVKVPVSPTSGICWKNTAKSRDGRLWQSIRTMASQVLIWSVLIYREC